MSDILSPIISAILYCIWIAAIILNEYWSTKLRYGYIVTDFVDRQYRKRADGTYPNKDNVHRDIAGKYCDELSRVYWGVRRTGEYKNDTQMEKGV